MPRVASSRALARRGLVRPVRVRWPRQRLPAPVRFAQDVEGPGPGHDRIRPPRPLPNGLVEVLQGFFLVPGHAVADAAGQVGLGKLGPPLDLPRIVGDGQVDFSLAAVDPCPPGIELARSGDGAGSAPKSGRACTILRGGRVGAWLPPRACTARSSGAEGRAGPRDQPAGLLPEGLQGKRHYAVNGFK